MWVVSIFWGWYLVDMVGDEMGWKQAKWILSLMLGVPAIIALGRAYKVVKKLREDRENEESDDPSFRPTETETTENPMITEL